MSDHIDQDFNELLRNTKRSIAQLNKHDGIRVKHWLQKLQAPVTNNVWKQNRNFYLKILVEMISEGKLFEPFNQTPPEGPLPKLTLYDVPYPIRSKISIENERKQSARTPSYNKTYSQKRKNSGSFKNSYMNSRKNSSYGKIKEKVMQHKKKINFEGSSFCLQKGNDENINISNRSTILQDTIRPYTMKTDEFFHSNTEFFLSTQQYPKKPVKRKSSRSIKDTCRENSSNDLDKKGLSILKKSLKLLGEKYEQFSGQISYKDVIENIVEVGEKYGENMKQISLNLSEQQDDNPKTETPHYLNYTKRIKQNFMQSDNNYKQFMDYLQGLEQ